MLVVSWHVNLKSRQGKSHWIYSRHGMDNQPNTKNHLTIGALIVKRPMLLKWKWTNIWYFPLGKSNLLLNNVERLLQQKILQQHTKTCSGDRYLYVNIVRNQSYEAEFLESNLKRFKSLSKYAGHRKL